MCPPGVDQTTRSSQRWTIILPAKQQRHQFQPGHACFPPEQFIRSSARFGAFEKLVRSDNITNKESSPVATSAPTLSPELSFLEQLPAELLSTILSDMQPSDVLALGMCSRTLWAHALSQIRQDARRRRAPWANTPLMITGTWLTDLPPAMYEMFPKELAQQKAYEGRTGRWHGACPARRWNWSARGRYKDVKGCDARAVWLHGFSSWDDQPNLGLSAGWRRQLRNDMEAVLATDARSGSGHWLLRNLTAKKIVRLEGSSSQPAQVHVEGAPWLSPDIVLVLHILWGTGNSHRGNLLRGEWAGHCFDIVSGDGELDGDWTDVTGDVVKKGKRFGCNIREIVKDNSDDPDFRDNSVLRLRRRGLNGRVS